MQIEIIEMIRFYPKIKDDRYVAELNKLQCATYSDYQFPELAGKTKSEDILERHRGMVGLRMLTTDDRFNTQIVNQMLIPIFMRDLIQNDYPHLKFQAAWLLGNFASGSSNQPAYLMNQGMVNLAIEALEKEKDSDVLKHMVRCLSGFIIYQDESQLRKKIASEHVLRLIIGKLRQNGYEYAHACMQYFANLLNCKPQLFRSFEQRKQILLQMLKYSLNYSFNDFCLTNILCWTYYSFCSRGQGLEMLEESGVLPIIIRLCEVEETQGGCIMLLGNICQRSEFSLSLLLEFRLLETITKIICSNDINIRIKVCKMIAEICEEEDLVEEVIRERELIDIIFGLYSVSHDTSMKINICKIIRNIIAGYQYEEVYSFLLQNKKRIFSLLLQTILQDAESVIIMILEITDQILTIEEEFDGSYSLCFIETVVDKQIDLMKLLQKSNSEIHEKLLEILNNYSQQNIVLPPILAR